MLLHTEMVIEGEEEKADGVSLVFTPPVFTRYGNGVRGEIGPVPLIWLGVKPRIYGDGYGDGYGQPPLP